MYLQFFQSVFCLFFCCYTCAPLEYERNMVQNLPCPEVSLQKQHSTEGLHHKEHIHLTSVLQYVCSYCLSLCLVTWGAFCGWCQGSRLWVGAVKWIIHHPGLSAAPRCASHVATGRTGVSQTLRSKMLRLSRPDYQ